LALPDLSDGRHAVALIDGEVVWMNPPSPNHEMIVLNLRSALLGWTGPGLARGYAITRPLVRVPDRPLGYEADLGWYPPGQVEVEGDDAGALVTHGLPPLVAEVWSPSNWSIEVHRKVQDYARAGIAELWGVSPELRTITRFTDLAERAYGTIVELGAADHLTTGLLPGFTTTVAGLFVP